VLDAASTDHPTQAPTEFIIECADGGRRRNLLRGRSKRAGSSQEGSKHNKLHGVFVKSDIGRVRRGVLAIFCVQVYCSVSKLRSGLSSRVALGTGLRADAFNDLVVVAPHQRLAIHSMIP
jgi:hypothetical protein